MPWAGNRIFWFLLLSLLTSTAAHATSSNITRGRTLYLQYCASCHGPTAEGDGPIAHVLTTPPANLRRLSERFGSPLPLDQVARYIDGRVEVKAHGPRDMPVWDTRFYHESGGDERRTQERIADLIAYLQSVQTAVRHASLR
jgi:mono/diheme cytochrome c family protein